MSRTSQSPVCDLIGFACDLMEAEPVFRKDAFHDLAQYANDVLGVILHKVIGVANSPYLPVRSSLLPWGRFSSFDGSLRDLASQQSQEQGVSLPINTYVTDAVLQYTPLPSLTDSIDWQDLRRCHDMKPVILL